MLDNENEIASIRKNSKEQIRIALGEYKSHALVSVRIFFEAEDGSWRPSKKGLAFKRELALEVADGIRKAVAG